jgi:hypothetical protein
MCLTCSRPISGSVYWRVGLPKNWTGETGDKIAADRSHRRWLGAEIQITSRPQATAAPRMLAKGGVQSGPLGGVDPAERPLYQRISCVT